MGRPRKNRVVPISLPDMHMRKLNIMRERTGLSYTGIVQRLIENHDMFKLEEKEKRSQSDSAFPGLSRD